MAHKHRYELNPQMMGSLELSEADGALKHSDGLWNPSPNVGSRRPNATRSLRRPRLLDTRKVPLHTPQTTTCLTFRTPIQRFLDLSESITNLDAIRLLQQPSGHILRSPAP